MNQFNLSMLDYEIPMYSTFKGWQSIQCNVKKGEKGHQIQVYSINKKLDKEIFGVCSDYVLELRESNS